MKKILYALTALLLCAAPLAAGIVYAAAEPAAAMEIKSRSAYLLDFNSGAELFSHNSAERRPIASMVKIMTLLLCFEDMAAGKFAAPDMIPVSENAASMGGSQAFLDFNKSYKADDLLKSITIASANDSCVAMAEFLSGSVEEFVSRMNSRAAAMGMADTNFVNCTGLPAANQYCSARDTAVMMRELLSHPEYYRYTTIWLDEMVHEGGRKTELANTNKLIRAYEGCDAGKTGFTNDAMFCLAASAKRGNMRLISVITGSPESKLRFNESAKLLNYGFANYENKQLIYKDIPLEARAVIKGGKTASVAVAPAGSFFAFGKKGAAAEGYELRSEFYAVKAPVKKGAEVGKILAVREGAVVKEVPLIALEDCGELTYLDIVNGLFGKFAG